MLEAALAYLAEQPVADERPSPRPSASPAALQERLVVGIVGVRGIC